ncbi:MAG: hypothetical protein HQL82_12615 [Magnetococcales bacterium]|nr:hypothetical protein [Magnetococcales bacterium]
MTCGIDEILNNTRSTLDSAVNDLIQGLTADYDLDVSLEDIANAPQTRELLGALQSYAVWLIHERGAIGSKRT